MATKQASNPAVAFAVLLAGVISVAVGLAMMIRVFPASSGPSVEGLVALVFFIVGLMVSLDRMKRDIVASLVEGATRDQGPRIHGPGEGSRE